MDPGCCRGSPCLQLRCRSTGARLRAKQLQVKIWELSRAPTMTAISSSPLHSGKRNFKPEPSLRKRSETTAISYDPWKIPNTRPRLHTFDCITCVGISLNQQHPHLAFSPESCPKHRAKRVKPPLAHRESEPLQPLGASCRCCSSRLRSWERR